MDDCWYLVADHVAYRDTVGGSWFIQTLVQVFREQYKKEHVLDMMTEVLTFYCIMSCRNCFLFAIS